MISPEYRARGRAEYLAWAKMRALEYIERGDLELAVTSMISDLGKHSELRGAASFRDGVDAVMSGDAETVRKWIEGIR
jgi:hypothetical protein